MAEMKVYHLSAECYPVAKVGGLADVVGSLPKHLPNHGVRGTVVMPKYRNDWTENHRFETVHQDSAPLGEDSFSYRIQEEIGKALGFPLYVVDIPERFDRPGIYLDPRSGHGYWDEFERFLSFQIAALDWIKAVETKPDVLHCHDHHTALVPFIMTRSYQYRDLQSIPTVLTIHNAEYQGIQDRHRRRLLPDFNMADMGLLDWDGKLNSLAAGIKCCWQFTTVSPTYMEQLAESDHDLAPLIQQEFDKARGILNGIDTEVWNPETDPDLEENFSVGDRGKGKRSNKEALCRRFNLDPERPTFSYIGRLAREKGADLLPDLIRRVLDYDNEVNFVVLGTGDPVLHEQFHMMNRQYVGYFDATLEYNESLAHLIYGGSDFILMPSRVEPCGLNQMYAMRYGTIPIVRETGGLKDTVKDISVRGGYGLTFREFTPEAAINALDRALELFDNSSKLSRIRKRIMELDFSWNVSAKQYIEMYKEIQL
ncbi:MAG: glycogen/starch synthase [Balneolaceae bacterium]|nr:glycogen/starch synthase [Balneolaceae bacterium]